MVWEREVITDLPLSILSNFFNFFKYLSSNFLLFYPNNIFTVYFPSNLLFLNTFASEFNSFYFVHYTLLISSSLISFSNSFTNVLISLLFNIFSTLHFFFLSISIGRSGIFFYSFTYTWYITILLIYITG